MKFVFIMPLVRLITSVRRAGSDETPFAAGASAVKADPRTVELASNSVSIQSKQTSLTQIITNLPLQICFTNSKL